MNKILTEKQYQQYIIDYLVSHDGYIERKMMILIKIMRWIKNYCSNS